MRALTLTQPWAGLVASSIKLVENRPRPMIKRSDFGKLFALHASRNIDESIYRIIRELLPEGDGGNDAWVCLSRITSAVIAVAAIDRVVDQNSSLTEDQQRWFFGPIGYILRDVRALTAPVKCRGWQGFWTLSHDTERAVLAQVAA